MVARMAAIWLLLLVIAIAAASLRERVLSPRIGDHGAHVVGTLLVVAAFAGVIWATVRWVSPTLDRGQLLTVGVAWLVATVLFEFAFGHYVVGHPWSRLLADYNLAAGRVWVLVLLTLLCMPAIAGELQRASP
ncbi:MAG: hypothetical protein PVH40_10145 [Gemmatimonadales bacterium]|jgi:hypothetical protein